MIVKQDKNRYYNPEPDHKSYREEAVDLLKSVCKKTRFQRQTWHLSVAIFDSFLSRCQVEKSDRHMVAFACLHLSSKHLERPEKIPSLSQIMRKFKGAFSES